MSGHSPGARSPERFELERILAVETVEGIVHLSVQIAYDPWDAGSIYDHVHAITGLHDLLINASIRAEEHRGAQYDHLRDDLDSYDR
jgi:hypothetical protein